MRVPWAPWERRWRDTLCEAMIPPLVDGERPGFSTAGADEFWREYQEAAPLLLRFGFRLSVWTLTLCPPLVVGKPTTFCGLGAHDRQRVLERVAGAPMLLARQLPLTVKLLACFAHLRRSDVRAQWEEPNP